MNQRDRFLSTILFGKPDRIPLDPGMGRKSTLQRWHGEGLPAGITDGAEIIAYAYRSAGGTKELPANGDGFPVNYRMIPEFEEKVLEERERTRVVQDWKGNICEISSEYTTEYLRNAIDFVTRRWIKCPVESREDWQDMRRRYDAEDPSRLPVDGESLGRRLAKRAHVVEIGGIPGPFWQLREWLGLESLCTMFHDDPAFLREMIAFWDDFVCRLLRRVFSLVVPDAVHFSEDMAYKSFSMISPSMVREFLLPTYARWGERIREAGCPVYAMDSDGFVGELIPLWVEAGINACDPVEVAADNDIADYRRRYGKKMAFRGGVDKRAIAKGGAAIEAEMQRLRPVIESGGYIPSCDHGVPPDVSWKNYVFYTKLLAEATGWL